MIKPIAVLVCTYKDKYFNIYKVNVLSVKTLVVSSLLGPLTSENHNIWPSLWNQTCIHAWRASLWYRKKIVVYPLKCIVSIIWVGITSLVCCCNSTQDPWLRLLMIFLFYMVSYFFYFGNDSRCLFFFNLS